MLRRSRPSTRPLAAVVAALLSTTLLMSCSGDGDDGASDPAGSEPASTTECTYEEDGQEPAKEVEAPASDAPDSGETTIEITTSAGAIGATLDREATPCTVNSFVSLSEQGYFDATQCHRLTISGIFVLQCGDPTASGMGGPGYSFADELSGEETYPAGTLAMANAGADTNGSQFFIVFDDTELPPSYNVFGQIDEAGLETVRAIAEKGTADGAPDGSPKDQVDIESITVVD